jgi:hypothetical protein
MLYAASKGKVIINAELQTILNEAAMAFYNVTPPLRL